MLFFRRFMTSLSSGVFPSGLIELYRPRHIKIGDKYIISISVSESGTIDRYIGTVMGDKMREEWQTLESRLKWAINQQVPVGRRRGLRLFQRRMEGRSKEIEKGGGKPLLGRSLSTIQNYLSGQQPPPLSFLQEAARVLGIRESWLISNEGGPTEAHAEAQLSPGQPPSDRLLRLKATILGELGLKNSGGDDTNGLPSAEGEVESPRSPTVELIPYWLGALNEVWLRLRFQEILSDPAGALTAARNEDDSADRRIEKEIARTLAGPLEALSIKPAHWDEETLGDYVVAMSPALLFLASARNDQLRNSANETDDLDDALSL